MANPCRNCLTFPLCLAEYNSYEEAESHWLRLVILSSRCSILSKSMYHKDGRNKIEPCLEIIDFFENDYKENHEE